MSTLKSLEEFKQYYKLEGITEVDTLYKNYLAAEKIVERKKGQYQRRKERHKATLPADYKPKVGRPRKVNPHEVKLQEEKESLQAELEALRKKILVC